MSYCFKKIMDEKLNFINKTRPLTYCLRRYISNFWTFVSVMDHPQFPTHSLNNKEADHSDYRANMDQTAQSYRDELIEIAQNLFSLIQEGTGFKSHERLRVDQQFDHWLVIYLLNFWISNNSYWVTRHSFQCKNHGLFLIILDGVIWLVCYSWMPWHHWNVVATRT